MNRQRAAALIAALMATLRQELDARDVTALLGLLLLWAGLTGTFSLWIAVAVIGVLLIAWVVATQPNDGRR